VTDDELARDPTTSQATLRRLANRPSAPTRALVAANPNTPVEVLLGLVKSNPEAVLSNPAFALALLADVALLDRLSNAALVSLARSPSLPPDLARAIHSNGLPKARAALAQNAASPPDLLVLLATDAGHEVQACVLARTDLPPPWADLMRKASAGVHDGGPRLEHDETARLLSAGPWSRWLLTQQSSISEKLLEQLLAHQEPAILDGLASRHGARLLWDERLTERLLDAGLSRHLVGNPLVPLPLWPGILARKPDLLDAVLGAPTTTRELVELLLGGEHHELRSRLAASALTPAWCLDELARDEQLALRLSVANNPHTPPEALGRLATDPDPTLRLMVASSPRTPASSLGKLSSNAVPRVRQRVAANPSTPPDALARLATDPSMAVRIVAARNPSLPKKSLETLAQDSDAHVRNQAAAVLRGDLGYTAWTPAC